MVKGRRPPFGGYANCACTDPIACRQEVACAIPWTLSDDTGAPDYGVGQLSAAIHCPATGRAPTSPRCDALRLAHCPWRQIRTIQGFLSTRSSGPVMIAVLQSERSSLKWRLWTPECNVTKCTEAAATPRSCRVATVGGLDRR